MTDGINRSVSLRQMLNERRRAIEDDVRSRIRHGRADRTNDIGDAVEHSDTDSQDGIDFRLLQMRSETLTHVDTALLRLDAGKYGSCVDCDGDIPERRLRALPFAVRCQSCEERREVTQGDAERRAPQRHTVSFTAVTF
jgi:RNA polymerase-binding transcription factor